MPREPEHEGRQPTGQEGSQPEQLDPAASPGPELSTGGTSAIVWWILGLSVAAVVASSVQIGLGRAERGCYLLTLCFLVCTVGAWHDVATRRIPNRLTYPAIVAGLLLNAFLPPVLESIGADVAIAWLGASGLRDGLLGFGLCAAIGVVSFMARGLGGGDVKILAAVGAMLGLQTVLAVLFNTLVAAALIGLGNWALSGKLVPRLQAVAGNLYAALLTRQGLRDVYPFGRSESPFGLALLLGLGSAQFVALHHLLLGAILA